MSLYPPSHREHASGKKSLEDSSSTPVERIVTTLPSATEIVCLLGLEDKLVGITHECDYPATVRAKPVVMRSVFDATKMTSKEIDDEVISRVTRGQSIYEIDETLLRSLKPDLIITQELCEVCATPLREVAKVISSINSPRPRTLSLTPHNLEDVIEDILRVGDATGSSARAIQVAGTLSERVKRVRDKCEALPEKEKPRVFCLEWLDPIYNSGHWMPELVKYAGGVEALGSLGEPSRAVAWDEVLHVDPEVLFVTVCGYDVGRTLNEIATLTSREGWNELNAVKKGRVYVLDSPSYFSRSGPRLVDGLEILAYLLHPELFTGYQLPELSAYDLAERRFISGNPKNPNSGK